MKALNAIWQWYLRRNWFVKIWIVLIIISAIGSSFDNSVSPDTLETGDCVVDAGGPVAADAFINAPTSYEIIKCSDAKATAKVLYIKEMYKQDWTDKQWQSYAEMTCPSASTSFVYPVSGLIAGNFICWLDESIPGYTSNLVTETIQANS
jgi:hypothetical protein